MTSFYETSFILDLSISPFQTPFKTTRGPKLSLWKRPQPSATSQTTDDDGVVLLLESGGRQLLPPPRTFSRPLPYAQWTIWSVGCQGGRASRTAFGVGRRRENKGRLVLL